MGERAILPHDSIVGRTSEKTFPLRRRCPVRTTTVSRLVARGRCPDFVARPLVATPAIFRLSSYFALPVRDDGAPAQTKGHSLSKADSARYGTGFPRSRDPNASTLGLGADALLRQLLPRIAKRFVHFAE